MSGTGAHDGFNIGGVHVGYQPRCKLCNTEHRAEAEQRYLDGNSFEKIWRWLNDEKGFKIGYEAVRNHIQAHFLVREHAAEQLAREEAVEGSAEDQAARRAEFLKNFTPGSQAEAIAASTVPILEDAAAKKIADVDMLDELALQDYEIRKKTSRLINAMLTSSEKKAERTKKDPKVFIPIALIQLHTQSSQELRQNRKTRAEIMGEVNNGTNTLDLAAVLVAAHDLREKARKVEEDAYEGDNAPFRSLAHEGDNAPAPDASSTAPPDGGTEA